MSGLSWNISIPCDATFGRRRLAAIRPDVPPDLDGFPESPALLASSRNNVVESTMARAVVSSGIAGLEHLARGFDGTTGKCLGHGPWATLVEGDDLERLVEGARSLLARWRDDPSLLIAASRTDYGLEHARDALQVPASTVAEAIAIYDERRSAGDGDDLHCLVALLQAHAALAWHARNHGLALFQVTWLY